MRLGHIARASVLAFSALVMMGAGTAAFEAENKLTSSRPRDAANGERIIDAVRRTVEAAPYKDSIAGMTVVDVMPPFKVSVDFTLKERLSDDNLAELSNAVRAGAGRKFERYFVGFYVEGSTIGGYWASAHQDPDLKVKIIGLSAERWDALMSQARSYRPEKGETIVANVVVPGFLARHLVIVRKGDQLIERSFYRDVSKSENPLEEKGGRYWLVENGFGENYRIRDGRLELHDRSGIIDSYPLVGP